MLHSASIARLSIAHLLTYLRGNLITFFTPGGWQMHCRHHAYLYLYLGVASDRVSTTVQNYTLHIIHHMAQKLLVSGIRASPFKWTSKNLKHAIGNILAPYLVSGVRVCDKIIWEMKLTWLLVVGVVQGQVRASVMRRAEIMWWKVHTNPPSRDVTQCHARPVTTRDTTYTGNWTTAAPTSDASLYRDNVTRRGVLVVVNSSVCSLELVLNEGRLE